MAMGDLSLCWRVTGDCCCSAVASGTLAACLEDKGMIYSTSPLPLPAAKWNSQVELA